MQRLLFAALSVGLLASQGTAAQSAQRPRRFKAFGMLWRRRSRVLEPARSHSTSRPNLTIITARHYSRVEDQADGPRPVLASVAKASADELRAAWGPFVSEAGTYEVAPGGLITMRPIASKNPAVMGPGVFITYAYKLDGDTLTLTQQRNQSGPSPIRSHSSWCVSNDNNTRTGVNTRFIHCYRVMLRQDVTL